MVGLPSLLETAFTGWRNFGASVQEDFVRTQSLLKRSPPPTIDSDDTAKLARMVETEIIPRLMLAHRAPNRPADPGGEVTFDADAVEDFAQRVLSTEPDLLIARVKAWLEDDAALEDVYVDLLIPAARRLGEYWSEDRISFTDATIGLDRLQQVVRTLSGQAPRHGEGLDGARSALFVSGFGGEQSLGQVVMEDCFRRAGWRTSIEPGTPDGNVEAAVSRRWFDLVGLSADRKTQQDEVKGAVDALRKASKNPDLFILAGGRLFQQHPELVSTVGADAAAANGADALLIADKALRRLPSAM